MAGGESLSTGCLLPSSHALKRTKEHKAKISHLKPMPLELDATGPQAHLRNEFGLLRPPPYRWSVIHQCTKELPLLPEDNLHSNNDDLKLDENSVDPSEISSPSRRPPKVHKLDVLISDHLSIDDPIRKRIENGANGGIQVMQWRFMRSSRITTNSFGTAVEEIRHQNTTSNSLNNNVSMDVIIESRSGISPTNSLITPDTINASTFFRFFDISKVGPWKILDELGSGSTSKVKLAVHEISGVKAAIKIIPREVPNDVLTDEIKAAQKELYKALEAEAKTSGKPFTRPSPGEPRAVRDTRIYREISMLRILSANPHPSILKLKDALWGKRLVLLILDYAPGGSLLERLTQSQKGPLSEKEAREIFRSLLSGVAFLHSAGIVHRDLKIENILLDASNRQAFIIDFGLANFFYSSVLDKRIREGKNFIIASPSSASKNVSSPSTGSSFHLLDTFCGSLYYAAPELLVGRAYPGPAIDIWSLGVILFAMFAGRVPFDVASGEGGNNRHHVTALHAKIIKGCPTATLPSGTSPEFINLIAKMLQVDPRARFTARELLMEDPWVLACDNYPTLLICVSLACTPVQEMPKWGCQVSSAIRCCRGRIVDIGKNQGDCLEERDDNNSHISSESCCQCCEKKYSQSYSSLSASFWKLLYASKRFNSAIDELEILLAFQYPKPLLCTILESFFLNSKIVAPCSSITPWPLVSMFLLSILKQPRDESDNFLDSDLWRVFYGFPPPKAPIKLFEDGYDDILSQLRPRSKEMKNSQLRTIYFRNLFNVDFVNNCSSLSSNEMLDRLAMCLGHLPGVIGGVVPVSITQFNRADKRGTSEGYLSNTQYCKYVVTLQLPPNAIDTRWREAPELTIVSPSVGDSLQIFPMMSMSVELVRIFWTQSYGLVFDRFSGSFETFFQIKTIIHRMLEQGEAPKY